MRTDHQDALVVPEHAELVLQGNRASGGGRFELGVERLDEGEGAEQNAERPERRTAEHVPGREWTRGN
jgi:hypothetical protein